MEKDYINCFKQACKQNSIDIKDTLVEINIPILIEDKIKERLKDLIGIKEEFIVRIDYNDITVEKPDIKNAEEVTSLKQEIEKLNDEIEELNCEIAELNGC